MDWEENSSEEEYWSNMEEEYGRDELISMNDPYSPNEALSDYLSSTDSSCTNEELGWNDDGERDDY